MDLVYLSRFLTPRFDLHGFPSCLCFWLHTFANINPWTQQSLCSYFFIIEDWDEFLNPCFALSSNTATISISRERMSGLSAFFSYVSVSLYWNRYSENNRTKKYHWNGDHAINPCPKTSGQICENVNKRFQISYRYLGSKFKSMVGFRNSRTRW